MRRWINLLLIGLTGLLLGGCASRTVVALTGDTLMLGEVRHTLTRELEQSGRLDPASQPWDVSGFLQKRGYTQADLVAGRLHVIRKQIYWNNTVSGIIHNQLDVVRADESHHVAPGNIVEFTATGHVKRVRARNLAEGSCYYGNVPVGSTVEMLGALSMVGPRGSASLYCRGIELEGWHRPRMFWHRLPDAVPGAEPLDKPPVEVSVPPQG